GQFQIAGEAVASRRHRLVDPTGLGEHAGVVVQLARKLGQMLLVIRFLGPKPPDGVDRLLVGARRFVGVTGPPQLQRALGKSIGPTLPPLQAAFTSSRTVEQTATNPSPASTAMIADRRHTLDPLSLVDCSTGDPRGAPGPPPLPGWSRPASPAPAKRGCAR